MSTADAPGGLSPARKSLIALAVLLMVLGGAQTPPGGTVLRALGLTAEPPAYTELSFTTPAALPDFVQAGAVPEHASFEIRNRGTTAQDYRWSVYVERGKRRVKAGSGALRLGPGAARTLKPPALRCTSGPVRVVVQLDGRTERITFHSVCQRPGDLV
ncbi:hypothetical protein [Actinocorallia longicatena]|uniref:Uncharacterized protein n=1 Tax=Actinocorallia longicatena TaxID=111803 RepID=A0ABP6QM86_9ACTN